MVMWVHDDAVMHHATAIKPVTSYDPQRLRTSVWPSATRSRQTSRPRTPWGLMSSDVPSGEKNGAPYCGRTLPIRLTFAPPASMTTRLPARRHASKETRLIVRPARTRPVDSQRWSSSSA